MKYLKEILDRFTNARINAIEEIKSLKKDGVKLVGTYCTFMPEEVISAAGAIPFRLCETRGEYILDGEKYLPRNLCQIVKSSYGAAISQNSPYFKEMDMIVGETTCDGKKKMYEYLQDIKSTYVMQLPQKSIGEEEYILWKNEINRLIEKLEIEFDVKIAEDNLKESIKEKNKERLKLNELYGLWRSKASKLKAVDIYNVLFNYSYRLDKKDAMADINQLIEILEAEPNKESQNKQTRILLTGCPLGEKFETIINLIEDLGGDVVAIETCDWMKGSEELVDESIPAIDGLTKKYLNIPCPVMTPNYHRLNIISSYLDKYEIDGVIDIAFQACLTFAVETIPLKRFIAGEKGVSYMSLETNLMAEEIGQLRTRIEAFLEMI